MNENKFELVLAIVNEGFAEEVMEVAKRKGARGGTIIHGRGTASKEAENFFNISITPEKEIVMIALESKIKNDVMHEIYDFCGTNSEAKGIVFSLPIDNEIGLSKENKQENVK